MEMCYDGALVMPNNFAVVNEEEMTYVEGGWDYTYSKKNIAVPIKAMYLSKNVCLAFATHVIFKHRKKWYSSTVNGMSSIRIASELYAHAVGYYASSALYGIGLKTQFINDIRSSGKTADIGKGDGLDAAYAIIWAAGPVI